MAPFFAKTIQGLGFTAHAPQYTEVYDLIADKVTEPGYLPERKARTTGGMAGQRGLRAAGGRGQHAYGEHQAQPRRDNKSLARFADQLRQLLEKWRAKAAPLPERRRAWERGLQLHAVELRRRILVFFDGVPVVVRKQVPEPQGRGRSGGRLPGTPGREIGGEELLLGIGI